MQILVLISIILLTATQVSTSNESTVELVRNFSGSGHSRDVMHLFSGQKSQLRFRLTPPPKGETLAQLYQQAGSLLAPVGSPIFVTEALGDDLKIELILPKHQVETRYLLVFDLPGKPQVVIKAYPKEILSPLKKVTKKIPLILIAPPKGLAETLQELGVSNRVTNQSTGKPGQIVIDFRQDGIRMDELKVARLVLPRKQEGYPKEIWMSDHEGAWRVRVPLDSFDSARLKTAEGQANLVRYLISTPR